MVIRPSSRRAGRYHAQILYGLNVDDGEINFGLYDPDPSELEMRLVPLEKYFNTLYENEIYSIEIIRHGTVTRQ